MNRPKKLEVIILYIFNKLDFFISYLLDISLKCNANIYAILKDEMNKYGAMDEYNDKTQLINRR